VGGRKQVSVTAGSQKKRGKTRGDSDRQSSCPPPTQRQDRARSLARQEGGEVKVDALRSQLLLAVWSRPYVQRHTSLLPGRHGPVGQVWTILRRAFLATNVTSWNRRPLGSPFGQDVYVGAVDWGPKQATDLRVVRWIRGATWRVGAVDAVRDG
jgi:hypothetical protein